MYFLYYSRSTTETAPLSPEYAVNTVSVRWNNRAYLDRLDIVWHILTLGRYQKMVVLNAEGAIVHTSRVIGKCYKFPFLSKHSAEIGPCATAKEYRGRGIYPMVLKHVLAHGGYSEYYMLVHDTNTASIRGIEKAGFVRIGQVQKRHGRWIQKTE